MPVSVLYKYVPLNIIVKITDISKKGEKIFRYKFCIYPENITEFTDEYCEEFEILEPLSKSNFDYKILYDDPNNPIFKINNEQINDIFSKRLARAVPQRSALQSKEALNLVEKIGDLLEKQVATDVYILKMTERVVDYSGTLDVYFKGISVPKRIEDNDFLDSRDFKKWFIQNFKMRIKISDEEYQQLIQNWFDMAEQHSTAEDPLTSFFQENFLTALANSYIYEGWANEAMERLITNSGTFTFIVDGGKLYVPSRIMNTLRKAEKVQIRAEKVRMLFKDFLVRDDVSKKLMVSIDGKKEMKVVKFWVFNWEKMREYYPSIASKELIKAENEEINIYQKMLDQAKTTDIFTLLSIIKELKDKIDIDKIAITEELKGDIEFVLNPENQKDMDNYEWLQKIIEKMVKEVQQSSSVPENASTH